YPFGLNHDGPWYEILQPKNKHQYNGKELTEDLGLNWNDYGARWYDPASSRWSEIDPLAEKYYAFSSFGYVANNPIRLLDPNGMIIVYDEDINKEDRKAFKTLINYLRRNSNTFKRAWKDLKKSEHTHTIHSGDPDNFHVDSKNNEYLAEGNSSDIYLNPTENNANVPQEAAVAHEIGHAWRIDQGLEPEYHPGDFSNEGFVYTLKHKQYREFEATHFENIVRSELGLDLRETYGQLPDQNISNVHQSGFLKGRLDASKQINVLIGINRTYNYNQPGHYQRLHQRKRSKDNFNLKKYTDVNEFNN
ncbi:MAG TPA: RHS repeat-associated core domain-containing protein, partial [Ignavibacteria bacterium]|nr:RHS repeat-associated core domain-containing protein [Ignavibacteria bacterium]